MKKQKLLIIFPVVLLILLIFMVSFYNSKEPYVDTEMGPFIDYCEKSLEGKTFEIKCRILLEEHSNNNSEDCYAMRIYSSDQKRLFEYNLCQDKDIIETDLVENQSSELFIPAYISWVYEKKIFTKYSLDRIFIEKMGYEETLSMINSIQNENFDIAQVYIPNNDNILDNGYYIGLSSEIFSGKSIGIVVFNDVNITDLYVENGLLVLQTEIFLNQETYEVKISTQSIPYYDDYFSDNANQLDVNNFQNNNILDCDAQISFIYIDKTSNLDEEDIYNFCNSKKENVLDTSLCLNFRDVVLNNIKIDNIDDYLYQNIIKSDESINSLSNLVLLQVILDEKG